ITVTATAGGGNTLAMQGTNGNDTIALQNLGQADRAWVNNRAVVTFANYGTVNLNGQFGDDKFNVSPVGLSPIVTTINVSGADSTNGDSLVVNGAVAANDVIGYNPTGLAQGFVTITGSAVMNFNTTEAVTINGQGTNTGDTLTVTTLGGPDQLTLTPGTSF